MRIPDAAKLVLCLAVAKAILIVGSYFSNPSSNPIQFLANWDFVHFQSIAEKGYIVISDYAFSPLYPTLLKILMSTGLPPWAAGFAITNAFSFAFPLILMKLYGFRVALLVELFPVYLVYGLVPYSDVLTLTFLALAVYFLSGRARPFKASAAFSLAMLNTYAIAWVLPSLALAFRRDHRQSPPTEAEKTGSAQSDEPRAKRDWVALVVDMSKFYVPVIMVGIGILVSFAVITGSPWTYFAAERAGWNATVVMPQIQYHYLYNFNDKFLGGNLITVPWNWRVAVVTTPLTMWLYNFASMKLYWVVRNVIFEAFYIACAILLIVRRKWFDGAFTLNFALPLFFIASVPSLSIPRLLLSAFPSFRALPRIPRIPLAAYFIGSVAIGIVILWLQLYTFFG